jgi:hypothetical protein
MLKVAIIVLTWFLSAATTQAQSVSQGEVSQAQSALLNRINAAANAFSTAHNISHEINMFCLLKLGNELPAHVNDGYVPFGVNYYDITDRKALDSVIYGREVYEIIYRKRCMAETKQLIGE